MNPSSQLTYSSSFMSTNQPSIKHFLNNFKVKVPEVKIYSFKDSEKSVSATFTKNNYSNSNSPNDKPKTSKEKSIFHIKNAKNNLENHLNEKKNKKIPIDLRYFKEYIEGDTIKFEENEKIIKNRKDSFGLEPFDDSTTRIFSRKDIFSENGDHREEDIEFLELYRVLQKLQ